METEQLMRFHIVLGKGPFKTLLLCVCQLAHQVGRTVNREGLGGHRSHTILLTFSVWV